MSEYERVVDSRGVVRYKLNKKFVKASEVPEDVKASLEEPTTAPELPQEPAPEIDPAASPDDIDDESGIDYEEMAKAAPKDEEGMGFKRVDGKTVDIFDGKTPHTHVRYVSGLMVPLNEGNYNGKSDLEIITQLKKLGKNVE